MKKNYSKKVVTAGLMLALGIILPYATAHGFGMPGNILLPMHIPVLLCGFFCGPLFGALCGLILPILNSVLTGMPVLYPMAPLMTCELVTYGLICGLIYNAFRKKGVLATYTSLIAAMIAGRIIFGIAAWFMLYFDADAGKFSVIASTITGIPGIIIQLIIIPVIVSYVKKGINSRYDAAEEAIEMIKDGKATCVTVKNNKIISAASPKGIAYLLELYDKNGLDGVFLADTIIGKAAAIILTQGGAKACYGYTMSNDAIEWLNAHNIPLKYTESVSVIQNRKGDGMCPMEQTVKDINDPAEAIVALRNKIAELRKAAETNK